MTHLVKQLACKKLRKIYGWLFRLSGFRISFIITILILIIFFLRLDFIETIELKSFNMRFKLRGETDPGDEVVIATIDEKSIREIGRWPWDRSVIAKMIERLESWGVSVITFDIVQSERDIKKANHALEELEEEIIKRGDMEIQRLIELKKIEADTDLALMETLKRYDNIVLGYFFFTYGYEVSEEGGQPAEDYLSKGALEEGIDLILDSAISILKLPREQPTTPPLRAVGITNNLPMFSKYSRHFGYFNMVPDPQDGVLRWYPLVIEAGEGDFKDYFPALGLKTAGLYLDADIGLNIERTGVSRVFLKSRRLKKIVRNIPADEQGKLLIDYNGPEGTFRYVSVADILTDDPSRRVNTQVFKDKIVLVGATAIGIYDLRVTPFDKLYPGVETHANVIENILHENYMRKPQWFGIFDLILIIALGLILGTILQRLKALTGALATVTLIIGYSSFNQYLFVKHGIWLSLVYPILAMFMVYTILTIYRYMTEEREKKKIKNTFQFYVSSSVVDEVLKNPEMLKLGGEKRELSVLFSDIRGFTTISERLTPEALVHLLNEYLTPMTEIVFKHQGTLDKYIGDAIMAFYGAPIHLPDHSLKACITAIEMLEKLKELNEKWQKDNIPSLDIGIGINTGSMSVGNMGSLTRFDYTVMGDSVNLGSRLEGINKVYGTNITISESTFEGAKEHIQCRILDHVRVKGRREPVRILELIDLRDGRADHTGLIKTFEEGFELYRSQQWDKAIGVLETVLKMRDGVDGPSSLYINRCRALKESPPGPDWDGVFIAKTK